LESPLLTGPSEIKIKNFIFFHSRSSLALNGMKLKRQLSKVTIKKALIEKSIRAFLAYSRLYKLKSGLFKSTVFLFLSVIERVTLSDPGLESLIEL